MADLRTLVEELAAGRMSRRTFVRRATALGVSASLLNALVADPALAVAAQGTPAADGGVRGPAAEFLRFGSYNIDQAPLNIRANDMDLYLLGLKPAAAADVAANPQGVRLIQAPASTISLILNPAPAREGEFNPFADKEIRKAMQFLVDRDFIANDIFQGRAVPMYSHVSPFDYDELTVFETIRGLNIRYDAEFARATITARMESAGATLENNVWTFGGRPILLKIITRVEDERRDIGDLVRTQLEQLGFQAQPIYQPFAPATLAVYVSDPITFQWHIYTEGWGRGAPVRYDDGAINQFAAPWVGSMPGWQETGFWQYEQAELDEIGQRLALGTFKSREERDELYRTMTALALDESVRVWVVTQLQSFPVREELQDVTEDLVSGPGSLYTLREAHREGSDEVRVGHLWVWTERTVYNPIGGFGDVYSSVVNRNLVDPGVANHPFTGLPQPFRTAYAVETAGPDGTLAVPEDAVLWDAAADAWTPVGGGVTAVSKITYDYAKFFQAPYHHGQRITPADLLYSIAQGFELAYDPEKVQIETAIGITSRPFLETIKAIKLLDDDRLEVYVDYWHFEPDYIGAYAAFGVSTPWEMLYAMDDLVFAKRQAAYSDTAAGRFSVPWLSLVTESDSRLVVRTLRQFLREEAIPAGVFEIGGRTLVTPEDAAARYEAAIAWFDEKNMLVVSNGPYYLNRFDPPAQFAELVAFRDENYPFKPGDWLYGAPERLSIAATPPPPVTLGAPLEVPVQVTGPGALSLRYVLVDPAAGTVAGSGDAAPADGGAFTVSVDPAIAANLFPGIYQLYLLASSDAIAQVAEQRVDVEVSV